MWYEILDISSTVVWDSKMKGTSWFTHKSQATLSSAELLKIGKNDNVVVRLALAKAEHNMAKHSKMNQDCARLKQDLPAWNNRDNQAEYQWDTAVPPSSPYEFIVFVGWFVLFGVQLLLLLKWPDVIRGHQVKRPGAVTTWG